MQRFERIRGWCAFVGAALLFCAALVGSLEETMVAGAKSSIAFQATLQVRNRFVQAYSEVMNMQI